MATATDYYALLGLQRNATEEQIRSAYRKFARQYHPDVNKATDAAEKFNKITEAYEVLSDAERRQRYDMFGNAQGGLGDFGIGDLFETFFGAEFRRREPRGPMRGADLRMEIEIELIDSVKGGERTIRVPRLETCAHCEGSGAEPGSQVSTCGTCNGRGEVRQVQQSVFGRFVNVSTCPRCGGSGKTIDKVCTKCRGEGRERRDKELELTLPPGIDDGQQLRVATSTVGDVFRHERSCSDAVGVWSLDCSLSDSVLCSLAACRPRRPARSASERFSGRALGGCEGGLESGDGECSDRFRMAVMVQHQAKNIRRTKLSYSGCSWLSVRQPMVGRPFR